MTPRIPQARRERAVNLPPLVVGAIVVLLAIQAGRGLVSNATDLSFLVDFSFIPAQWSLTLGAATAEDVVGAAGRGVADVDLVALRKALARYVAGAGSAPLWSPLSYAFLHGSWMHVGLNALWLAAFAAPVVTRAGNLRSVALAAATAIGGGIAQWLVDPLSVQPMIGASAVVSGFMAAAATFIFNPAGPANPLQPDLETGWSFLTNRKALLFLAAWFGMNLLFGIAAGPLGLTDGAIAWEAHIGGLLVGLFLFPLLDPTRHGRGRSSIGEPPRRPPSRAA